MLTVLVAVTFARTVGNGFYNDDYLLARPWSIHQVIDAFHGQFDQVQFHEAYFRPLSSLSFALEWHVWGTNRWGYHLDNIVIHCVATSAVWIVLRRLRVVWWAAFSGAAYFAVVPSNAATVVYIAERTDAMVAICICAILWCLVRFADSGATRWLVWANGLYVIALLSKEVAVATVPFVAVFWLYLRVERHEPLPAEQGLRGVQAHWANEARVIGRSVLDRSAQWFSVLGPLVVVTAGYLLYRTAVLPAGSLSSRYSETQSPLRALVGGIDSTIKRVPWEIRALPFLPVVAAFAVGFALRPRSRAWRVALLGLGGIIAGVLPLTFSGGVEPRLLYVAEIGLAIAIAGLATVFGGAIAAARRRALVVRTVIGGVVLLVAATVATSQLQAQDLYKPGGDLQVQHDLDIWEYPARTVVPAENLRQIQRHLFEAGLIDKDGNVIPGAGG